MDNCYKKYLFLYINDNLTPRDKYFLEHQDDFMKEVMRVTKDSKFYDNMSNSLKKDGDFILELIDLFEDDYEFLNRIGEECFKLNDYDSRSIMEICVKLSDICEKTQEDCLFDYYSRAEGYYQSIREDIRQEIMSEPNLKERKKIGEGFIYVDMTFHDSPVIKEFIAKKMVRDMLFDNPMYNFEELVHYNYNKLSSIKDNEKQIIFNLIRDNDQTLSDYMEIHPSLLEESIEELKFVESNWNDYIDELNTSKIDQAITEMEKYIVDNNCSYNLMDYFKSIVMISNNSAKIMPYLEKDLKEKKINHDVINLQEMKFIRHMKDYLDNLFEFDVPYEKEEIIEKNNEEQKYPCKIIKLKGRK